MNRNFLFIALFCIILSGCNLNHPIININNINMQLTSPAFTNNSNLPAKYTCDGQGINPPLMIAEVPANALSLALVSDDPDAPMGTYVHWVVWNINPKITEVKEGIVPSGANLGKTSSGTTGYVSPCPPSGTHRYYFKVYALDIKLELTPNAGKDNLERAIQGHILDSAEIIGLYQKN